MYLARRAEAEELGAMQVSALLSPLHGFTQGKGAPMLSPYHPNLSAVLFSFVPDSTMQAG